MPKLDAYLGLDSGGAAYTDIRYRLYDATNTPVAGFVTTGITHTGHGRYEADVAYDTGTFVGRIEWTSASVAEVFAFEDLSPAQFAQTVVSAGAPDYTQWPTAGDLKSLLQSQGFYPAATADQGALDIQLVKLALAAADEFQRRTGQQFIATGSQTRNYAATDGNGYLELGTAVVSVSSIVIDGRTLVAGTDYWTMPENAVALGQPVTGIQFAVPYYGWWRPVPDRIQISGTWGFSGSGIPPWPWETVEKMAALQALGQANSPLLAQSRSQPQFSKSMWVGGRLSPAQLHELWRPDIDRCIICHTRVVV